ncbi:MAG: GGDEF domain-containing protein [Salinisphaera sp.]|nr:GGDEF domain-containing protein [Salinisphaera sp.]
MVGLRFRPVLERQFRDYLRASAKHSRITVMLLGIIGTLLSLLIDQALLGAPAATAVATFSLRIGVQIPFLTLALIAVMRRPRWIVTEWLLMLAMFAMICGLMAQRIINSHHGFDVPLELTVASILAMCTLARVPFWRMTVASFVGLAVILAAELMYIGPYAERSYDLFCSALIFGIAIASAYFLEYFIRSAWLNSALLRRLATVDGLTGLLNRAALDDAMSRVRALAAREQRPYAVALIDIDAFGDYNEHFGHQTGDTALSRVAGVIAANARRPNDVVGRYGGEEFVLVWTDAVGADALAQAESLRSAIEALQIPAAPTSGRSWVTVSIGLGIVPETAGDTPPETVIRAADQMLYAAKSAGRNCVRQATLDSACARVAGFAGSISESSNSATERQKRPGSAPIPDDVESEPASQTREAAHR